MKTENDFYDCMQAAVQYYSTALIELANHIQKEFINLSSEIKQTIINTKLHQMVGISLEPIFIVGKIDMSTPAKAFEVTKKILDVSAASIKSFPRESISDKKFKL